LEIKIFMFYHLSLFCIYYPLFPQNMIKPLDLNFLLLEDIYLPIYLRELRILDYFDFEKDHQN
jgi:hypothetical protein